MITLAIESSSRCGSVALVDGAGSELASRVWQAGRGATSLPLYEFLAFCRKEFPPPQRVLGGLGPGSYAGTRIGLAAAMGAAMAWRVPLVGLPSVLGYPSETATFRVLGDARRETVYHAIISQGRCVTGPELLDRAQIMQLLQVQKQLPVVSSDPPPWWPTSIEHVFPTAVQLVRSAFQAPEMLVSGDTQGLEPLYLRPPTITRPANSR